MTRPDSPPVHELIHGCADITSITIDGSVLPVVDVDSLVIGTGAAGYCAADQLWENGIRNIAVVADMVGAGASRNAGSDKQTYYKLTLAGDEHDSPRELAKTLYSGGAMDGDLALVEAAVSPRAFLRLCQLGVPFPQNEFGEFVGYKTDHDPRTRATSVGPYTSRTMVQVLERKVQANGTAIFDRCRVVEVLTAIGEDGRRQVCGLLALRNSEHLTTNENPFILFRTNHIVYATGGPAGMYARRVFPNGQWGASGAGYRAGVIGKNLTEWQFGLASIKPRWNVSGSYMQVIPRFVSTNPEGKDEREFLSEAVKDTGLLCSLIFRKGYQWPFDARKAHSGSSLIDLLVHREVTQRGRRVFLDFRTNPDSERFSLEGLDHEASEYLERAGVTAATPIERLMQLNAPAYWFYRERNPGIDLATEMLEIDLCAQHNNGGLSIDTWWESNVQGFFPVGEAAGSHGIYRPGGAALNSGQVGAIRAAQRISQRLADNASAPIGFDEAATCALREARHLVTRATHRHTSHATDDTVDILRKIQHLMSEFAGPVRSEQSINHASEELAELNGKYQNSLSANPMSRKSIDRLFLIRDILTTAMVYLHAMQNFLDEQCGSRGSVIYLDPQGTIPHLPSQSEMNAHVNEVLHEFGFTLDDRSHDDQIQETWLEKARDDGIMMIRTAWRPRRPIPETDDVFEQVWKKFRQGTRTEGVNPTQ